MWKRPCQADSHVVVFMLIFVLSALQQGCLAAAWLAAVGADSMRTADVRFEPFENSWVSTENAATTGNRPSFTNLALVPIEGDEAMGARLTNMLLHETALHVVSSGKQPGLLSAAAADPEHAMLASHLCRELVVEAVMYGYVVGAASSSDLGRSTEEPRRLFLYLVDLTGHLLWKDELPYLIIAGAKPALEESVQRSFTRHFMDHVRQLGLDDLGYLPSKAY